MDAIPSRKFSDATFNLVRATRYTMYINRQAFFLQILFLFFFPLQSTIRHACSNQPPLFLCFRNSVSDLQSHLSTLELRVARETRRRLSLEDEVRRLRDENRRLQDESHAAAQQLRRFTEWFFQTIDHQ